MNRNKQWQPMRRYLHVSVPLVIDKKTGKPRVPGRGIGKTYVRTPNLAKPSEVSGK